MFENEGTEIESTQSDVTPETSSESQDDAQTGQQAAAPQAKEPPFHEHPRWIERQNELNAERQARVQLEQRMAEMQRKFEEAQKPKDTRPDFNEVRTKMAERLKGIDPEFQSYMSLLEEQSLSAKQELQAFREEQFVNRAVSRFEELNKANGVSAELAPMYRAQLDLAYREGKIRTLEDLEKTYKAIHEPIHGLLTAREKQAIEKYTTEKKKAAAVPSAQPKGRAPANGQGPQTFKNEQERRSALIKEVAQGLRASREV